MTPAATEARVPPLRFPGFTEPWEEKRLGDVGSIKSGVGFPEREQGKTHGFPFFKVSDMSLPGNESKMVWANNYVSKAQAKKLGMLPIQQEAIIFAKVGAALFLERKRLATNFLIDNNMMAFVPSDQIDHQFAFFLLSNIRLSRFAQVGALPSFNSSDVGCRQIFSPSLIEQQKIAGFLGAVDRWVAGLRARREGLAEYKRGVMQRLFSRELRFTRPDGTPFPDWQQKRLGDIAQKVDRISEDTSLPVMTISAGNGFLMQKERFSQVIAGSSLEKYTHVLPGEFAYNRGASKKYPFGCVYLMKEAKGALVPFVYRSFKIGKGVPEFWEQYFVAGLLNSQLRRVISSSARLDGLLNISEDDFYASKVCSPHPEEQRKIAGFLGALDRRIDTVTAQITTAEAFKRGLLQQMFV